MYSYYMTTYFQPHDRRFHKISVIFAVYVLLPGRIEKYFDPFAFLDYCLIVAVLISVGYIK